MMRAHHRLQGSLMVEPQDLLLGPRPVPASTWHNGALQGHTCTACPPPQQQRCSGVYLPYATDQAQVQNITAPSKALLLPCDPQRQPCNLYLASPSTTQDATFSKQADTDAWRSSNPPLECGHL